MIFLVSGCRRDPDGPRWDVELVAPVVNTSLTIADIVPDSLLETSANGDVTLVYRSELFGLKLDTVLTGPDTSFNYSLVMPIDGYLPPGFTLPATNDVTRFDLDDLELSRLRVRSGTLALAVSNQNAGRFLGTFSLPGCTTPANVPFSVERLIPAAAGGVPGSHVESFDLAGFDFDLRGPDADDVNTLSTQLAYQVDPQATSDVAVNAGDSIVARVGYNDVVPAYAKGYFGSRVIDLGPDGSTLDIFGSLIAGTLDLDQVAATLSITNGVGADMRIELDHLTGHNTRTGTAVDLAHTITSAPLNLNRALDQGGSPAPSTYTAVLNNGNSNLDAWIENLPDSISYAGSLRVNPLGNVSNGNDFLYYESEVRVQLDLEVPLRLIATGLTLEQLVTPDLPGSSEGHAIQGGTLHLFATNGFPFDAVISLDVVDGGGTVVGSFPVLGTIASGVLGADGLVSAPTSSRIDVSVPPEALDLLYATGRARIRAAFTTADQTQHLRILDSYRLDLKLTVDVNYLVNGDE
ncbi:MAG: hypothetical protein JNL05_05515 [Flavobacteriales bacterium]|nr:hypothetical protein [Flavobacteriales bacterium]